MTSFRLLVGRVPQFRRYKKNLLDAARRTPFKPNFIQLSYAFRCHVTHLGLLAWHDINLITFLVDAVLTTLLEDPVCQGLILWIG